MNDMVVRGQAPIAAFSMSEQELIDALESSLYPGAKLPSIKLVVNVCRAQHLDPFQKPYHIVPMQVKTGEKDSYGNDIYAQRDVVMPGVGLYRTQAARTSQFAGISEPQFGPMLQLSYTKREWVDNPDKPGKRMPIDVAATLDYPEWCKVTVRRIVAGQPCDFTAVEYWIENYATIGKSTTPNSMWVKRIRGQIVKCAEAQALRKAFPELGSQPTADEMEGKWIDPEDGELVVDQQRQVEQRQPVRAKSETGQAANPTTFDVDPNTGEITDQKKQAETSSATNGTKSSPPAGAGMLKLIRAKAAAIGVDEARLLACHKLTALDGITVDEGNVILKSIASGADAYTC